MQEGFPGGNRKSVFCVSCVCVVPPQGCVLHTHIVFVIVFVFFFVSLFIFILGFLGFQKARTVSPGFQKNRSVSPGFDKILFSAFRVCVVLPQGCVLHTHCIYHYICFFLCITIYILLLLVAFASFGSICFI